MEVNFNHDYKDCFGNKILEENSKESIPKAIWRHLAFSLFNLSSVGPEALDGKDKYMAYSLSYRIAENPESVEMTTEEASFLKKVCACLLSAGAYGQVEDIIEGRYK